MRSRTSALANDECSSVGNNEFGAQLCQLKHENILLRRPKNSGIIHDDSRRHISGNNGDGEHDSRGPWGEAEFAATLEGYDQRWT